MKRHRGSRRAIAAMCGLLAIVLAATACGGGNESTASKKSSITIVQKTATNALLPDVEPVRTSLRIDEEILEAATRYVWDGKQLKIEPALAESWEQTGPKTWLFHVRPNVKFHNGEPLTADAFKFSLDAYRANKAAGAFVFSDIELKVVDPMTFQVTTKTANLGALPSKMSFLFAYAPKYYAEKGKAGFGSAPIGTGPYKLQKWERGIAITLTRNPDYWGAKPAIETLVFRTVADDATRVSMLQTGQADVVADLPPPLASRVDGLKDAHTEVIESQRRIFFFFNNFVAPTNDVRVRQAINYAVDAQAIIDSLFQGHAYPLKGIYLTGELGYIPGFTGYTHDPEKAKQLLAATGHPNGLTVDLHYTIGSTVLDKETAEAVQGQLAAVGIKANMDGGPVNAMEAKFDAGKSTGMNLWSYGPIYNDSSFLTNIASFSSTALYGPYSHDAKTDALTQQAVATTDQAERQKLYEQIQDYVLMQNADWVPLYALQDIYGVSDRVVWKARPDQNYAFETATLR